MKRFSVYDWLATEEPALNHKLKTIKMDDVNIPMSRPGTSEFSMAQIMAQPYDTVASLQGAISMGNTEGQASMLPQSEARFSDLTKIIYRELFWLNKNLPGFDSEIRENWQAIDSVGKNGFDAKVLVNENLHEICIAIEGTHGFMKNIITEALRDPEFFKDLQKYSDGFKHHATPEGYEELLNKWKSRLSPDGYADLQMFGNKVPDEFCTAYDWFKGTMDKINCEKPGYNVVVTGHSLGGALAQLVSGKYYLDYNIALSTVAFDGPGVLSQLETLAGRTLNPGDFSHIINYVTEGDPVGEFMMGKHVGVSVEMPYTLSRNDEFWQINDSKVGYRIGLTEWQKINGLLDIRIDRHDIMQQIDIFNGTDFSYPQKTILLGDNDDIYRGTSERALIMGNGGNDQLFGGANADFICGGDGDDCINGGSGSDFLTGDAGNDTILGGEGKDLLSGGKGADYLDGGTGNDQLYGGDEDDTLVWSGGNDLLYGQKGDDLVIMGLQSGNKFAGDVTIKFDHEQTGNDKLVFNLSNIDARNSHFTLFMADDIKLGDISVKNTGNSLYLEYGNNSSVCIDNWAGVSQALGNDISIRVNSLTGYKDYKLADIV